MVRIFKNPRFISKKHHVLWILNIVAIKWQICPVFLQSYINKKKNNIWERIFKPYTMTKSRVS